MIKTLTGSNHFLIQSELMKAIHAFVAEYGDFGLERYDGEEAEYDQIREALESLPFLASKKLVILRNAGANKDFLSNVEQLLGSLPETTDLIIHEPKLDKRSVYYKFLRKATDYQEFNELDDVALAKWLVEEAKTGGGSLTQSDARYLIERVGLNQQLLHNELTKLLAYNPKITVRTIDLLTEPTPQSTVFQLLDAAFAGNTRTVLRIYEEQRAAKVEPLAIVGMLAWQLHVLAIILSAGDRSDGDIAKEAKLNPFVVRKSRQLSHKMSLSRVEQLVGELLDLDVQLKTTAINADDALQDFLLHI